VELTTAYCREDCCGNDICDQDGNEDYVESGANYCKEDCCGDGECSEDESYFNCKEDCGSCPTGITFTGVNGLNPEAMSHNFFRHYAITLPNQSVVECPAYIPSLADPPYLQNIGECCWSAGFNAGEIFPASIDTIGITCASENANCAIYNQPSLATSYRNFDTNQICLWVHDTVVNTKSHFWGFAAANVEPDPTTGELEICNQLGGAQVGPAGGAHSTVHLHQWAYSTSGGCATVTF
jgi:hypothetical protein